MIPIGTLVSHATIHSFDDIFSDAFARLPERECTILLRRFGLDGSPPSTLTDLGVALALSGERGRQLERRALRRVKHRLKDALNSPVETQAWPTESLARMLERMGEEKRARGPHQALNATHTPRAGHSTPARLAAIRAQFPRAYELWSAPEEEQVRWSHALGNSFEVIAQEVGRQPPAIASRLRRLGLI